MTLADNVGLSDSQERLITRGLQLALIGFIVYGLVTVRLAVAATASLGLGVTFLPAWLTREYDYSMDAGLVLWITIGMTLHVFGTVALYDQYQWYDEITHTVSATFIAGLGYAAFRAFELHSNEIDVPSEFRAVFILVFVLAAGMVWEVVEFAFGGLIPVYGIDDIVTDLLFNAVGAVVVAVWGTGYVDELVSFIRGRLRSTQAGR
jgi:hypothetical protein